jgi:DNA mismatch endonuclease (patch repair protein)
VYTSRRSQTFSLESRGRSDAELDIFDKQKRSDVMARIRSRGNHATEIRVIALLRAQGLKGWRRGQCVFGSPDFVFRAAKLALFVDGCFWHGCPRHGRVPDSRREYWLPKLARNKARDRAVSRALRTAGWRVVRLWECALTAKRQAATVRRVARALGDFTSGPKPRLTRPPPAPARPTR